MFALRYTALIIVVLWLAGCGITVQRTSLYDGVLEAPAAPRPTRISQVVEPEIFREDATDFWVTENASCTTGTVVTDQSHSGSKALKINWNRDPSICEWAGFGIGWDGWAGKDLSEVLDYAAIQMYVRTEQGQMFGLPIVLTLEDYSGNMAWSYVANKYMEGYYIDENWQKVAVPLNSFDLVKGNIDLTNVKQLMFELQQAGTLYFDDIELVFYDAPPMEVWRPELATEATPNYPVQLFGDAFINDHGWGLMQDHCQNIALTNDSHEGQRAIHARWDTSQPDCYQVALGASWNKWFPADLTNRNNLQLTLAIKSAVDYSGQEMLRFGFEDYDRNLTLLSVQPDFLAGSFRPNTWQTLTIPLSALPEGVDFSRIKQFIVRMTGQGEVWLDDIRLVQTGA